MEQLIFATNNPHKLQEVKKMLGDHFLILGMEEAGLIEDIPENEPTLEGNAREKAEYLYQKLKTNVFADDTGLEIDALKGAPGVLSARYAGETKNPEANMQLVLKNLHGQTNRKAQFRTVICLIRNHKQFLFEGLIRGTILTKKQGAAGFGYDPIFQPEGYQISFAEMPMDEKNSISHRGKAIQQLVEFLKQK